MGTVFESDREVSAESGLLDVLARLNQIGAAINRISARDIGSVPAILRLIAESAIQVLPGAAAVIYTYDPQQRTFDLASRVSAGEPPEYVPHDEPRPNGIGMRAIGQRRRVLSYEEHDLSIHPDKARTGARAMACFPLIVAYQPVGVLYVYLHEERHFSQRELLMLEILVNQAAMAIYQARRVDSVQRDLARKEEELSRLRRAGLVISSRLRLDETLDAILRMAMEVTGAEYGIFRLVAENPTGAGSGPHLVARAVAGARGQPLLEALPIDETSVMGWVATHRQPACIHDLQAAPWVRIYRPLYADLRMRSELAVPLIAASGRLEGVLNLESPLVGGFSEADSLLLQALATQAVIAIQEVRLLDAMQEVAERLLTQPQSEVLARLAELACHLLDVHASAIWTVEGEQLRLRAACGAGLAGSDRTPLRGSLVGRAVLARGPLRATDAAGGSNATWVLVVPLEGEAGTALGAFGVAGAPTQPDEVAGGRSGGSEWDEKVLTCLAHYAALAVENTTRQETLKAMRERHAVAEAFAAVGDVAANVLHQVNNKMGAIRARIQGIQDKCRPALLADPYLESALGEIERSARDAMEAVRESLSHLHPVEPAPVRVVNCVEKALRAVDLPAEIEVRRIGLDALPAVLAVEEGLVLVLTNLLANAAEAMAGCGSVTISGTQAAEWVEVSVSDTGPGIAPDRQERIFERDAAGQGSARGGRLGFGLWWVKVWMVRMGGSVSLESDGHHGTTFRLRLPNAAEGA